MVVSLWIWGYPHLHTPYGCSSPQMVQHLLTVFPVFSAEWKQQLPLNLPRKQGVAVKLQSTSRCPQTAMISLGYQLVSVMNVVFTQYTIDINRPSPNSPKMSGVYTFVGFAIFDSHVLPLEKHPARNGGSDEPRGTDRSPAGSLPISTQFPWNDLGWTRASTLVSVFPFS